MNFIKIIGSQQLKRKNYIRNVDTYISRCKDRQPNDPCFLGLYTQFEWLERIMNKLINNINYENMEHMRNGYRISIPKPLRKMVWRKRHKNTLRGTCDCCDDPIDYDTFEVGHDIAVANGGTNEIGNLYAICSSCNKDMGTMNYSDYRRNVKQNIKANLHLINLVLINLHLINLHLINYHQILS